MASPLNDPKLEALLDRLHAQSDAQVAEVDAYIARRDRELHVARDCRVGEPGFGLRVLPELTDLLTLQFGQQPADGPRAGAIAVLRGAKRPLRSARHPLELQLIRVQTLRDFHELLRTHRCQFKSRAVRADLLCLFHNCRFEFHSLHNLI